MRDICKLWWVFVQVSRTSPSGSVVSTASSKSGTAAELEDPSLTSLSAAAVRAAATVPLHTTSEQPSQAASPVAESNADDPDAGNELTRSVSQRSNRYAVSFLVGSVQITGLSLSTSKQADMILAVHNRASDIGKPSPESGFPVCSQGLGSNRVVSQVRSLQRQSQCP